MKTWRLYVDGECVGTYGDGTLAMRIAISTMQEWLSAGYTSEQCEVKYEEF